MHKEGTKQVHCMHTHSSTTIKTMPSLAPLQTLQQILVVHVVLSMDLPKIC